MFLLKAPSNCICPFSGTKTALTRWDIERGFGHRTMPVDLQDRPSRVSSGDSDCLMVVMHAMNGRLDWDLGSLEAKVKALKAYAECCLQPGIILLGAYIYHGSTMRGLKLFCISDCKY